MTDAMIVTRRQTLAALATGTLVGSPGFGNAEQAHQWFPITSDDGKAVANMRLPVEVASHIDELQGAIWSGSHSREITLVEFFDYNCPYCRGAAADLDALLRENPDVRLGLVNNPILSPASEQAARIELAVLNLGGPGRAYEFHRRLFQRRGVIDRDKALDVAHGLGAPHSEVGKLADSSEIQARLSAQMRLAASLGMAATPSFMIAGAGVFGYPGPTSLKRIIASVRACDQIAC
jgi:protein-disulfide isomerase